MASYLKRELFPEIIFPGVFCLSVFSVGAIKSLNGLTATVPAQSALSPYTWPHKPTSVGTHPVATSALAHGCPFEIFYPTPWLHTGDALRQMNTVALRVLSFFWYALWSLRASLRKSLSPGHRVKGMLGKVGFQRVGASDQTGDGVTERAGDDRVAA